MSDKFFFKGRKTPKPKHQSFGYNTNRTKKIGTKEHPFELSVQTQQRADELQQLIEAQTMFATIVVNADTEENIEQWTFFNQKPVAVKAEAKVGRNCPCVCGSGKKFKACCGR
ncbi:PBPRA1643 family SWIM/SEC-C metal-binding motif protein [Shewanella gelidii]|uniref:Zinc chelation protein SecC n=1 Tax=Shewanella gelidii TaxID=1642821 RepID=A0A917NB99_9GAMM|nr:PBPRA1643 family SWIM/SEC-C metal-binding motif protein [Shewanella gelidii]MCL1098042.1 SEC-C domain-containing protein [Shewanella gelidii]GGI85695.1 zinc chelation protein SecC [Shewanella gelidii]